MIDRIKQLMDDEHLSPTQLSEKIDVNRSTLTHLFSGRNQPSLDLARKILNAFPDINTEWLIMGVGPMRKGTLIGENKPMNVLKNPSPELDLFSSLSDVDTSDSFDESIENESSSTINPKTKPSQNLSVEHKKKTQQKNSDVSSSLESNNLSITSAEAEKIDSQRVKKIERIVFFYTDKSFEVYQV